jgi:hypothetical protein
MKMRTLIFIIGMVSISSYAGDLINGAKIIKVGSSNWNKKVFYVTLSGGTGPCKNVNVSFPEEYSQSTVAYAQSQSLAVTAFIHNKDVRIYNYGNKAFANDDICTGASLIEISN